MQVKLPLPVRPGAPVVAFAVPTPKVIVMLIDPVQKDVPGFAFRVNSQPVTRNNVLMNHSAPDHAAADAATLDTGAGLRVGDR